MSREWCKNLLAATLSVWSVSIAFSVEYFETEPNDSVATATVYNDLQPGDVLSGRSLGNIDYWRLGARNLEMGRIYMHSLSIAGNANVDPALVEPNFDGALILNDSGQPFPMQAWASQPGNYLKHRWYSFGGSTDVVVGVSRRSGSPAINHYAAAYDRNVAVVEDIGSLMSGDLHIQSDDPTARTFNGFQIFSVNGQLLGSGYAGGSILDFRISLAPGEYIIAVAGTRVIDPIGSMQGGNPKLEGNNAFASFGSSAQYAGMLPLRLSAGGSSLILDAKPELIEAQPYAVAFRKFTVVPESPSVVALGFASALLGLMVLRGKC